jgi:hypothetical protein
MGCPVPYASLIVMERWREFSPARPAANESGQKASLKIGGRQSRLTARKSAMILRAIPLTLLLFWLAYESHFSPSFFVRTVSLSLSLIADGIDETLSGGLAPRAQKVAAQTE